MREIKFRAWDEEQSKLFYGDEIEETEELCAYLSYGELYVTWFPLNKDDPHNLTVEQCTGLRDKNGKEIYEGDKVRAIDTNTHDYVDEAEDVVAYIGSCFSLSESWETLDFFGSENLEVIGNIHENPELLK